MLVGITETKGLDKTATDWRSPRVTAQLRTRSKKNE